LQAACFLLEFVANNILTPGKVENWMCISDLGYKGLTDLPLNTMRKITQVLQDIFKCRLAYSAIINPPKTLYFIWSLLKPFLDPVTIDKISLTKDSIPRTLLQFFDPYQVEERYGGKAPNLEIFWPPVFPALSSNPDDDNSKFGGVLKNDSIKDEVVYQSGSISQDPKVPYEIESANIYEDRNSPEVSYIPEVDHPKISEKKRRKGKKKSKKLSEIIVDNPNALEPELEHGLNEEQLGSQKEHKFESITNANEADITDVHKHSIERNSVVYIDTEQKIEIDSPRDNKCLKFNKYELKVLCGVDCKRYCAIF
jgi:CRAL/TRIO domain